MPTKRSRQIHEDGLASRGRNETAAPGPDHLPPQPCACDESPGAARADSSVDGNRSDDHADHDDLVAMAFLDLLDADAHANPERVRPVPGDLVARARELVEGLAVDLGAPLDAADE